MNNPSDAFIDSVTARNIAVVWNDPGVQCTYEHKSQFQISDSAKYFFDRIEKIGASNFVPEDEDILRVRARTTGESWDGREGRRESIESCKDPEK